MVKWFLLISSLFLFLTPEVVFSGTKKDEKFFSYYMPGLKKDDDVVVELYDKNYQKLADKKVNIEGKMMNIKKEKDSVKIISKYDSNYDLLLTFAVVSENKTWQISNSYLIPNKKGTISDDFDNEKILLNKVATDYVSPYHRLRAIDNIDGDDPDSNGFTGGWHTFDDKRNTPTAKMESFRLLLDEKEYNKNGMYQADTVKLITTNIVQGTNTKKLDGTGRGILKEKIIYTIIGGEIKVEVELTPLEDVTIDDYYFLQASTNNYNNGIIPVGDPLFPDEIKNFSYDIFGSSKEKSNCSKLILSDGANYLTMEIDPSYGIGNYEYNKNNSIWFYKQYGKLYFNLIASEKNSPLYVEKGKILRARGFYKFERKPL
ncbi:hypothetical protein [Enterococcus sp. DIV0660C]|uniref:hypothetical protein n=1 Tax=Enterococcus sp. DIV0660C TaxID=2230880 RepID=UPI001A8C10B4|nr:hypothetical protein [Enterococcus sp. DIV0660C]MBO0432879.1 hypothetical protein [Enterococcus sp. DIV0660C]